MKYLKRKADAFLLNWKSQSDRLPLVVKGARQIGKTETIRKFAAENYESVVEINFVTEPKYKGLQRAIVIVVFSFHFLCSKPLTL